MIKRTLTLIVLLLALSVSSALAASTTPAPVVSTQAAPASQTAPDAATRKQRLERLRDRLQKFVKHCGSDKADGEKCKAAALKMIDRLKKIDGRIDDRIAKIKERCGATPTGADAKKCGHAEEVVQRLRTLQDKVKQIEQKLQAWLDKGPAAGGTGSAGSGLESLDQLAADLAAVQAQAGN